MNSREDLEKPFSELCVISEEEKTFKGAIKWHIPKPEIKQYFEKVGRDAKYAEIDSNWFSIGSPSYCSFYIRVYPSSYGVSKRADTFIKTKEKDFCVSIIFNRKLPDSAWVKGEIYFAGLCYYEKHKKFSVSAKDFDKKIEFTSDNFFGLLSDAYFLKYDDHGDGVTIYCSMKISMRELKCAFDKEKIDYGESRDYDSSKETVKKCDSSFFHVSGYDGRDYDSIKETVKRDPFFDVKIRISHHLFETHKTVLAQIPYFQELFDANESKQYFELSNIEPNIFNHILNFLYSRDIPYLHFKLAYELYIVASDLKICDLKCVCSSYLGANLTEINVCIILKLSDKYEDIALKKECFKFIKISGVETLVGKAIIL